MTDTEIDQARSRLKQLAKKGPPPDERKNGSLAIVEKLYDDIAAARAAGWTWERIKQGIGEKVARWRPETLERYFQLIKKVRGTTRTGEARTTDGGGHLAGEKNQASRTAGVGRAPRGGGGIEGERQGDREQKQNPKYDADDVV
jgi:hypothetical protein